MGPQPPCGSLALVGVVLALQQREGAATFLQQLVAVVAPGRGQVNPRAQQVARRSNTATCAGCRRWPQRSVCRRRAGGAGVQPPAAGRRWTGPPARAQRCPSVHRPARRRSTRRVPAIAGSAPLGALGEDRRQPCPCGSRRHCAGSAAPGVPNWAAVRLVPRQPAPVRPVAPPHRCGRACSPQRRPGARKCRRARAEHNLLQQGGQQAARCCGAPAVQAVKLVAHLRACASVKSGSRPAPPVHHLGRAAVAQLHRAAG